jgi:hypothetical protein
MKQPPYLYERLNACAVLIKFLRSSSVRSPKQDRRMASVSGEREMNRSEEAGMVSLSIDLELAIGRQTTQGQDRLERITLSLIDLLDRHAISATWGVSNPALSAATEVIRSAQCRQEIAILGERFWLSDGTTPSRQAHELGRRFEGARRAGIDVSTLLLRDGTEHLDLNLLLEHGISAVRLPAVRASSKDFRQRAGAMRYRVWQVPSPVSIPLQGCWWQSEPSAFRHQLQEAVGGKRLHFVLDAGKMAESVDLGLPAVTAILRKLGQMTARGVLKTALLRELAHQDLLRRASHPSRSLLAA